MLHVRGLPTQTMSMPEEVTRMSIRLGVGTTSKKRWRSQYWPLNDASDLSFMIGAPHAQIHKTCRLEDETDSIASLKRYALLRWPFTCR